MIAEETKSLSEKRVVIKEQEKRTRASAKVSISLFREFLIQ
jgi:hypothetical protein